MAMHVDTFQAATVGAGLPAGWTARWVAPSWTIADDAGDIGVYLSAPSPAARWAVTKDSVDGDAGRADVDIIVRIQTSSTAAVSLLGIIARLTGATTAEANGYSCVLYGPDKVRINKYVAGVTTAVHTASRGSNFAAGTPYYLRFRLNGTSLQAKVWAGALEDQPGAWLIDIVDASITGAGGAGFFATGASTSYRFTEIAIGTNGDVAAFVADTTKPVLSSPAATAISPIAAAGTVSTNEAAGTLYFLASENATELAATVVSSGGSQPVGATGVQNVSIPGLTPGTTYFPHYVQVDPSGNVADRVTGLSFTTPAASGSIKGVHLVLFNGATPRANVTGLTALWWDGTEPHLFGPPQFATNMASLDSNGLLTLDLTGETTLNLGDDGFLFLYKKNAADVRDSLIFSGEMTVVDIS